MAVHSCREEIKRGRGVGCGAWGKQCLCVWVGVGGCGCGCVSVSVCLCDPEGGREASSCQLIPSHTPSCQAGVWGPPSPSLNAHGKGAS